jgi:hypothetical protein
MSKQDKEYSKESGKTRMRNLEGIDKCNQLFRRITFGQITEEYRRKRLATIHVVTKYNN